MIMLMLSLMMLCLAFPLGLARGLLGSLLDRSFGIACVTPVHFQDGSVDWDCGLSLNFETVCSLTKDRATPYPTFHRYYQWDRHDSAVNYRLVDAYTYRRMTVSF